MRFTPCPIFVRRSILLEKPTPPWATATCCYLLAGASCPCSLPCQGCLRSAGPRGCWCALSARPMTRNSPISATVVAMARTTNQTGRRRPNKAIMVASTAGRPLWIQGSLSHPSPFQMGSESNMSPAAARLGELADVRRHGEVERAELAVKVANLHEVAQRDLGLAAADLGPAPDVDLAEGVSLEQRVGELEARITSLGPINPLALDELAALEERYRDLDEQVSDVRHARRELQEVVRALDDEIMTTFASAYADVNEHFAHLVGMLFPGGQGRLILTDPDDPLNTGVEIEVRPMGRNIRRISLLSGGERSMVTLAFLFAVFRSRPSPFYMMDEVEAALDDVNLQRFLSLVDEFRDEAQLLIVTHQKRTMEAADALYGVTMVPGGSS